MNTLNRPLFYILFAVPFFLSAALAEPPASTPAAPTPPAEPAAPVNPQAYYADNIALRADLAESDLKAKNEISFPVYVISTMNAALPGVSLDVSSDQFEARVSPSTSWKTFPELSKPAGNHPTKEFFTVTLKKKSATPIRACDVVMKLYSAQPQGKQLVAFQPLSEILDSHEIPIQLSFAFDGTTKPEKWGSSFSLQDLTAYEKTATGSYLRKGRTRTRVQWAADKEYLYLLVTFFQVGSTGTVEIDMAPAMDAKPVSIVLNRKDGTVHSSLPAESVEFKKCLDDPLMILDEKDPFKSAPADTYEGRISLKALGITPGTAFYANAFYNGQCCWRGNPVSSRDPAMFARMVIAGVP